MAVNEQIIFHVSAAGAELTRGQMISLGKAVKNLGIPIDHVTSATKKGADAFGRMNVSMGNLIVNAIKWSLAYKILYGIQNLVLTAIRNSLTAWVEFDDMMAKVKTTTRDTGDGIEKIMRVFSREIQLAAMDSRQSIKDIADVMFYLGSAGLSAQEQLAGLKPTLDLATGTGETLTVTVRTLTGAYNTLKDTLGKNLSEQEKFTHMADVLAYTFSKEEVL